MAPRRCDRRCAFPRVLRVSAVGYLALIFALCGSALAAQQNPYATSGTCADLPKTAVTTPSGICVGVVASGFRFSRGVLPLENGDLLVVDMGGWVASRGVLWKLKKAGARYQREKILERLDRPHGLALGPDGRIYVGVAGGVVRFDLADPKGTRTDVIGGRSRVAALPSSGRHPLVSLVFGKDGVLFVNVGSETDNCADASDSAPDPCAEAEGDTPRGAIRRYAMRWPEGSVSEWKTYASGLRNSMALAVHPQSGVLLQGENSRDNIHRRMPGLQSDGGLPHDELNRIEEGARYGWPYCYDDGKPSPEYPKADCSRYRKPIMLLPAHAAPLGMTYYFGSLLPQFRGALVVGYHGYRAAGHRIVVLETDADGVPTGKATELVAGWEAAEGRPMGAPTDLKVGADGAIYVTEDRDGTVLRIAREQ